MAKLFKIFILLIFPTAFLTAQLQDIKFERISVEHGLSQSTVWCALQDSKGFMWFGTSDGLNRYDGYNFKVYRNDPADFNTLNDNWVQSIFEDRYGIIWIGTRNLGLNEFDPLTETFTHYIKDSTSHKSLCSNYIESICEDTAGILWIGTQNGLNKFDRDTKSFEHFNHDPKNPNSLSANRIMSMCIDSEEALWIGAGFMGDHRGSLHRFERITNQFRRFSYDSDNPKSLGGKFITSIFEDHTGTLWIGTESGLDKFNRESNDFTHYFINNEKISSTYGHYINSICEDRSGMLWMGTKEEGLLKFDKKTGNFVSYTNNPLNPNSISSNDILTIYNDNSGNFWIGTWGGGINKFNPDGRKFQHFKIFDQTHAGTGYNDVRTVYEDPAGMMWVGTLGGGLYKYSREKGNLEIYTTQTIPDRLPSNYVRYICEDKSGLIWIATLAGLYNYNEKTKKYSSIFPYDPLPSSNPFITKILNDRNDNIWIITNLGTYKLDSHQKMLRLFHKYSGVTALEDQNGIIWIGGENGLIKVDVETETFTYYNHNPENKNSLSNNYVKSLYEDKSGILWVGTAVGLNRFDRSTETFTYFTEKNGLPNDVINGILEDNSGNLWLSTWKGLSRFNLKDSSFKNYDITDVLQENKFNISAYFKNIKGEMFFGGINGVTIFHPGNLKENQHIPPIVLTDIKVMNKSIKIDSVITNKNQLILPYNKNIISIEFSSLDFSAPSKNKYVYLLEGFEKDWNYTDANRRFATYTNLDPGEYTFRVKGSNNDGIWNEEGTSIKVIILPPWWKTNWAYFSYFILFIGLFYSLRRYDLNRQRLKQELEMEHQHAENLEEVDKMKSRFFTNISHEFRTPLTLIKGPVKQMLSGEFTGNMKEQFKMILRNSDRLLNLINQLLDLSKFESGRMKLQVTKTDLIQFMKDLVFSFSSLAERKKISLKFNTNNSSIIGYVDSDKLEKIITNLLSNAFKFSPEGGVVAVGLSLRGEETTKQSHENDPPHKGLLLRQSTDRNDNNDFIQIQISNTGPGIPADRLDKIFDRFYQADDNYKKDSEGTGIGLALTKELVEVCHGEISVSSIPNKKTTFVVTLPITKECFKEDEIVKGLEAEDRKPEKKSYWIPKNNHKYQVGLRLPVSSLP